MPSKRLLFGFVLLTFAFVVISSIGEPERKAGIADLPRPRFVHDASGEASASMASRAPPPAAAPTEGDARPETSDGGERRAFARQGPPADVGAERANRDRRLQPYRTGTGLRVDRQAFELLSLRAIAKERYDESLGPLVSERLGYAIFAPGTAAALVVGDGLPVVVKTSNGMIGIVTGTVLVTLKDRGSLRAVESAHALSLRHYDEDLRLASFVVPESKSLTSVVDELRADASVEDASLEIVQSWKRF